MQNSSCNTPKVIFTHPKTTKCAIFKPSNKIHHSWYIKPRSFLTFYSTILFRKFPHQNFIGSLCLLPPRSNAQTLPRSSSFLRGRKFSRYGRKFFSIYARKKCIAVPAQIFTKLMNKRQFFITSHVQSFTEIWSLGWKIRIEIGVRP